MGKGVRGLLLTTIQARIVSFGELTLIKSESPDEKKKIFICRKSINRDDSKMVIKHKVSNLSLQYIID